MKTYVFKVYLFDEKTKQIEMTVRCRTKKIPESDLDGVIQRELMRFKGPVCFEVLK